MALVTKPNTFSQGTTIVASEHNANFDTVYNCVNGNIENANISSGAAIAYSKLTLSNSITNADINSAAAIADSKLAQITTAGKVSGAAITALASVPSGAGVLPVANSPAIDTLLPAQGSANGKFLTSNGSAASWATVTQYSPSFAHGSLSVTTAGSRSDDSITTGFQPTRIEIIAVTGTSAVNPQFNFGSWDGSSYVLIKGIFGTGTESSISTASILELTGINGTPETMLGTITNLSASGFSISWSVSGSSTSHKTYSVMWKAYK